MLLGSNTPLEKELKKEIITDMILLPKTIMQPCKYDSENRNKVIA